MIKIGVIDSGLGGLSVVKELRKLGVGCDVIYIYDNKYHPYGSKCREELTAITFNNVERLVSEGAELIVLGCNTITSACIEGMRNTFTLPIVGTEPPLKPAIAECGSIALLATPYTLNAANTRRYIDAYADKTFIYPDCSGLASAIEYSYANSRYIGEFFAAQLMQCANVEGVVLGCTHYYYIKELVRAWLPYARIYEPSSGVARRLQSIINSSGNCDLRIIATGEQVNINKIKFFL